MYHTTQVGRRDYWNGNAALPLPSASVHDELHDAKKDRAAVLSPPPPREETARTKRAGSRDRLLETFPAKDRKVFSACSKGSCVSSLRDMNLAWQKYFGTQLEGED